MRQAILCNGLRLDSPSRRERFMAKRGRDAQDVDVDKAVDHERVLRDHAVEFVSIRAVRDDQAARSRLQRPGYRDPAGARVGDQPAPVGFELGIECLGGATVGECDDEEHAICLE